MPESPGQALCLGGLGCGGWKGVFTTSDSGDSATGAMLCQAAWPPRRPRLQLRRRPRDSPRPGASHSPSFLSWGPRCMEGGLDPARQARLSGGPAWPHSAPSRMGEKRPIIVVQLSSPTCVFPRAAPQGATPAPRRPLSWPPPRVPCFTSCLWGDTFRLCSARTQSPPARGCPAGLAPAPPSRRAAAALRPQSPPCARSRALLPTWPQLRLLPLPHPEARGDARLQVPRGLRGRR